MCVSASQRAPVSRPALAHGSFCSGWSWLVPPSSSRSTFLSCCPYPHRCPGPHPPILEEPQESWVADLPGNDFVEKNRRGWVGLNWVLGHTQATLLQLYSCVLAVLQHGASLAGPETDCVTVQLGSARERQISHAITYMWNLKKWYKWTYLQNRNRLTDIENKLTVTKGDSGEEWRGREKLGVWD